MTTIQSVFEERLNEHLINLPNQYFSTSEVIKVCELFTSNLLWQDLYHHQRTAGNLTQTLIDSMPYVGKKKSSIFLFFVVFFFMDHMSYIIYKYSCTAKREGKEELKTHAKKSNKQKCAGKKCFGMKITSEIKKKPSIINFTITVQFRFSNEIKF